MSNDDNYICIWPDGDWCFIGELNEHSHKSDDYETIATTNVDEDIEQFVQDYIS